MFKLSYKDGEEVKIVENREKALRKNNAMTFQHSSSGKRFKYFSFKGYTIKAEEKEIVFLDEEELGRVKELEITNERLSIVRDLFVFSCYTGLAYKELYELTPDQITRGIDGELWLHIKRHKTGKYISIPLLEPALEIIEKYKEHPEALNKGKVFPVRSNQKLNEYLHKMVGLLKCHQHLLLPSHPAYLLDERNSHY